MPAVGIPSPGRIPFGICKKLGQIAPIITLTAFAPFIQFTANQTTASTNRERTAMYEPQKPQLARAITGKGTW